ncbi:MAG: hypothetical protein Q9M25_08245 [Mariprofundaceae bacterium]|nr:hypothetical protein [Mariprofundaceae bacterium]
MHHARNPHCRIFTASALNKHTDVILDSQQAHYLRSVMHLASGAQTQHDFARFKSAIMLLDFARTA